MTFLALAIKVHTGIRLAEVGEALGAIGGIALLVATSPYGRRAAQAIGGIALAAGFVLLIIATRWGHFH